jgi:hypothetical protein
MSAARITIRSVINQGPDFVREFIHQPHDDREFAPEFSWLALADSVGLRVSLARDTDPTLAARWAEIAATLYEGLAHGSRPQDDLARDIWTRKAARYRALAAGSAPPVGAAPEALEPHPL